MMMDHFAKPSFVNRAWRFVSGSSRRARALLIVGGGTLLATISGPFGMMGIAWPERVGFFFVLIGLNFVLWEGWFTVLIARGMRWRKILLLGLPTLLLPLPLEVALGLHVFAGIENVDHFEIFWRGLAITLVGSLALFLLPERGAPKPDTAARFPGTSIRLGEITALVAEDHYVRLYLADGSDRLLYRRFSDAIGAMQGLAGEKVSRGSWIADEHRGAAIYRERRWFVSVGPELQLAVSRGHVARLRDAGWLTRAG